MVEHVGEQLVVALRDTLAEVVIGHRTILSKRACVSRTSAAWTTFTATRRAFHLVTHRGKRACLKMRGGPGWTRTIDQPIMSRPLCPSELQAPSGLNRLFRLS